MKRRSRFFPTSKGQPVHGSKHQLAVLDLLQQYDCLPANYIRASLPNTYTQKVVNLLNQEGYIGVPEEAKHHINARYRPTIYEIRPKGEALLAKHEMWRGREKSTGHFRHKHMASVIEWSFRHANPKYRYKTQDEIISRSPWKPTKDDANPAHVPLSTSKIIPDGPLFGYELDGTSIHFHGFEADRGTEPLTSQFDRQNISLKVRHYAEYLRKKIYSKRYGLGRISILFITLSHSRAQGIQAVIEQEAKDVAEHFHVKAIPDFKDAFPPPTGHMAEEDWLDGFNIFRTLESAYEERQSRARVRAG